MVLLNLYVPMLRSQHKIYIFRLPRSNLRRSNEVVLWDIDCIQSPFLDCLGRFLSCRPELSALEAFFDHNEWDDSRVIRDHADEEEADYTVDHFTHWAGSSAS